MKLWITATLSEEEILILSSSKWYQETFSRYEYSTDNDWVVTETPITVTNPQSREEFLSSVYTSMIVADATSIFTQYKTQQLKDQINATEKAVRESVESNITSTIE